MGFYRGPNIVTNGLVLALDAGNIKSYQSGSLTWYDKSGNGFNGTLTNGPTFNSGSGGSIVFDGVDDYISCSSLSNYNFGTALTVEIIHKNTGGDYRGVISNVYVSLTGFDLRYGRENYLGGTNNGTRLGCFIRTSVSNYSVNINAELNIWGHYVFTYNNSILQSYKNGLPFTNTPATGSLGSIANGVTIGRNSAGTEYLSGSLPIAKIYNRALSAAEVLQNYNATKGRFNL
jgi:hypothetical protein